MSYNYLEAVKNDVANYIKGDVELSEYEDINSLESVWELAHQGVNNENH